MQYVLLALLASAMAQPVTTNWKNSFDLFTTQTTCSGSSELMSCSTGANETSANSCCVENPGGVVLFTQLWDPSVPNSPSHTWTIHGSWPDNCDGTYGQFCNFENTTVEDVQPILEEHGQKELVDYMNEFWVNNNGTNGEFWNHEFNKHATCMSTIRPSCYDQSEYKPGQNVVDFFKMSVRQYLELPTFTWLADAGITPSYSKTYKAEDIQAALDKAFGYKVFVGCTNGTVLDEVWYYHHVQGSLLRQNFVKMDTLRESSCSGDVQYIPKQGTLFKLW